MRFEELRELVEKTLVPLGNRVEEGELYQSPDLEILLYLVRPVRLGPIPILGRALSVSAIVRQPSDVGPGSEGLRALLVRAARASSSRFSPLQGLSIGLSTLILSSETITPEDDRTLQQTLENLPRLRAVPLSAFLLNLEQEALALGLVRGPESLFPEPELLAEALTPHFRRYVPPIEI